MKLGLVGLGKMGLNLGRNLIDHKHEVIAFDLNAEAVKEMSEYGAQGVSSYADMVASLESPRVLWIMVPHNVVDAVLAEISPLLSKGDIIIEAGNSHYKESIRRYEELKPQGIHYMDAGTSGGMEGARYGACYMI